MATGGARGARRRDSLHPTRYRQPVPEHTELPVPILIEEKQVDSETRVTSIGPYVMVLDTTIPKQGVALHSTYTGHKGTPTQATHLMLAIGTRDSTSVEHEENEIPVVHARRRCLYDHLQRLQDLLEDAGIQATIPIDANAIEAVEA